MVDWEHQFYINQYYTHNWAEKCVFYLRGDYWCNTNKGWRTVTNGDWVRSDKKGLHVTRSKH